MKTLIHSLANKALHLFLIIFCMTSIHFAIAAILTIQCYSKTSKGNFLGALYEKTEKVVFVKVAFSNSISQLNLDWTSTICGCQKIAVLANPADRDGRGADYALHICLFPTNIFDLPLPLVFKK